MGNPQSQRSDLIPTYASRSVSFHSMKINEEQIAKGFWYYRPNENFPPPDKLLSEYQAAERLSLIISHGNESDSQIRKREKSYSTEIITKLQNVKVLWVNHINQETFDSICLCKQLNSLYISSNRIKDLGRISNLKNLKHTLLY